MTTNTATHIPSEITAHGAEASGRLAGFTSVCSCGLDMSNTVRTNVEADVREHLAYWETRNAKAYRADPD